jgi:hypothetical protein
MPERVPSSVSPARASFERARPPARASWGPGDKSAQKRAYRPDVYSRGLGVSISGVLGEARVSRAAFGGDAGGVETSRTDPDPEWEWQGSWQREWQTSLESPDEGVKRRSRLNAESADALVSENARAESSAPSATPPSATPPAVSESTPKSLAETIRARADAADAEDSPAWTLSPSPERAEGEGEYSAYSPREKSATSPKRELVPPRGSPLRSPVSRSPLSFDLNRSPVLAAEPFPRLGAGSYQARRDARKASRRDEPFDAGGNKNRTGLDVRGDTSGAAVFY